jgi:hypothetical protein
MSHGNLLMIDPEITEPDRSRLRAAAEAGLLVPFRGPRPERPSWPPDVRREWPTDAAVAVTTTGAFTALFGAVALAEWGISAAHPFGGRGILADLWGHVRSVGQVLLYPTLFLISIMSALALTCAVAATRGGWTRQAIIPDHHRWHLADAARRHYRRYATAGDLDVRAAALWRRTQIAARAIRESAVIRSKLVDAAQVTAALPYRMWEIAGTLARMSALRAEQRDILGGIPQNDPGISSALDPQLSANERAETDAEECVGKLEELARSLAEADAARRRAEAIHDLRELTPGYHELLAGLGHADRMAGASLEAQLQAIIDQASEAIRKAEEAGLNLALPKLDDQD